jgi:AcrR family transcriptional regulator
VELVFKHALEELIAHGPDLSVDRIAKAAQLNKTSIYRRYPTKAALLALVLERVLDDLSIQVPDTGALRSDLVALVSLIAAFVATDAGRGLLRALSAADEAPELLSLAQRRIEQQAISPVSVMLASAFARGEWRPGVDPVVLLSMLVGAVLHRQLLERQPASASWIDAVVDIALRGVGVPPSAPDHGPP